MNSSKSRAPIFLIDKYVEDIRGCKLPSNRQALGHFLYLHREQKNTTGAAAIMAIDSILEFWERARIPVRRKQKCVEKIKALHNQWQALQRSASRKTEAQCQKQEQFKDCLEDLFDIADTNALEIMQVAEDKTFLLAQREKGRQGTMSSTDMILTAKEKRLLASQATIQKRIFKEQDRLIKETQPKSSGVKSAKRHSNEHTLESGPNTEATNVPYSVPEQSLDILPAPKRGRQHIITPNLAATLDRHKISDRSAVMIIGETARALGHNLGPLSLNRCSIRRQRIQHREASAARIQQIFHPKTALVVHWDGKMIEDLTGRDKVDRLPIIVSSLDGSCQLLAVPKIPSSTGEAQAREVYNTLKEWKIEDRVKGMCFDTTSSNVGRLNGACIRLEQLLNRDLLHLPCRHHILELVAGAAFTELMGTSSAPEILLFKRFQAQWKLMDPSKFADSSSDQAVSNLVADVKKKLTDSFIKALAEVNPRKDYRELLELALIFLGSTPPRGTRFTAPGAMHQARWMAKVIYSFKVWMFRYQFHLTAGEEKGLRDLCVFFTTVYVSAWTTAPLAIAAPQNDLTLMQSLIAYHNVNKSISDATSLKMAAHLWYLSEELVGLSLFDEAVSHEEKDRMVKAMKDVDGDEEPPKRVNMPLRNITNKSVSDFATKNTRLLLTKLELPLRFLDIPASQWNHNEDYQAARESMKALAVINDHDERSVALIQNFSGHLTKNEEQLQFLLQSVADHRKRFPEALKRNLIDDDCH